MERISIQELAAVLTVKNGLKKKEAERFVATIFETVKDVLKTDRMVKIKGLGTFKMVEIEPRESVNVNTGERVLIEGHTKVSFTPDTSMKDLVNKPFSQFETVLLNDGVDFSGVDDMPLPIIEEDLEDESEETVVPAVEKLESAQIEEIPAIVEEPEIVPDEEEKAVPDMEKEDVSVAEDNEEVVSPVLESFAEGPVTEEEVVETISETITEPVENEEMEVPNDEEPEPVSEENEEVTYDEEEWEDDEETSSGTKKFLWIVLALVACVLSFGAGYMVGTYHNGSAQSLQDSIPVKIKVADTISIDSVKTQVVEMAIDTPQVKAQPQPEPVKPVANLVQEESHALHRKYAQMDARVRTGAYYIVGTAQEVKVKEGETLKRIAHRHLGPDMECYIEVYNGINASTPLTVGQIIKIPKLAYKKKKKEQTNNLE